jgi:hypothetical protein
MTRPQPGDSPAPPRPDPLPSANPPPGLPGLHTWRAVYALVLGCFVLWVVLLAIFSRIFA